MANWTRDELERINDSEELEIAAVKDDGSLRSRRPIWVVRVGDDLYARAAYGSRSGWHRTASQTGRARIAAGGIEKDVAVEAADASIFDQVDAAYRSKYGQRYASIVDDITDAEHRATTLRLLPTERQR